MTGEPATLHFCVNTLALRRGGLVKAVMIRANALAASAVSDGGREVVIEVLAFQPRLVEDIADLVERGFLDARVHVRSILACLDPSLPDAGGACAVRGCVHHGATGVADVAAAVSRARRTDPRAVVLDVPVADDLKNRVGARMLARVPTRDDAGRLRHIESFTTSGERVRREEYGSGDRVVRILDYRPGDSRPVVARWIGRDGDCYLAVWQAPTSNDWAMSFAVIGTTLMPFTVPQGLYRAAFEHTLRPEKNPVLFSEFRDRLPNLPGRGFDEVVRVVRHPTLRRAAVVHSNHALQGQRTLPLPSSPNFIALLDGLDSWDLLVTATEQQKADIAAQYGHPERLRAIPHHAPDVPPQIDVPTDPNRFVLVARIHKKKRVDEAVAAFRLVVDGNPDARLDIYGFGYGDELEATVLKMVDDLGLAEHIAFKGFVDNTAEIYAGACATLQTSESEGFGMALLESLAEGVPVVAYDVMYGARDAVRDGVDGFVVPWGDRQAMADRLLELSRDADLRVRMGAAAPEGAARFSRERYVREWNEAIDALPVLVDASAGPTAAVRQGRFTIAFSPAREGTVVLRRRDRSEATEAVLADGAAALELPECQTGDILDVSVRADGRESRVATEDAGTSDDPTWRVYATEHGNLSLKKVSPVAAPAGDKASGAPPTGGLGKPAPPAPLARRALRRLRSGGN